MTLPAVSLLTEGVAARANPLPNYTNYLYAGAKILLFVALLAATFWVIDRVTDFNDQAELFDRHNVPYGVIRAGVIGGQALATYPLLAVDTGSRGSDFAWLAVGGVVISALIVAVNPVVDRVVGLRGNYDAMDRATMASAVVKAGFYVAAGLVVNAALSGSAPSLGVAVAATFAFAALGLLGLLLAYAALGLVGPFRRRGRLGEECLAAAVISSGTLVGLGLVLRNAIAGEFAGWAPGLVGFVITYALGVVVLGVLVLLIDKLVITRDSLGAIVAGNHVLAAVVMAVVLVVLAGSIAAVPV